MEVLRLCFYAIYYCSSTSTIHTSIPSNSTHSTHRLEKLDLGGRGGGSTGPISFRLQSYVLVNAIKRESCPRPRASYFFKRAFNEESCPC